MDSADCTILLCLILPTAVSTLCASIALICLSRLKTVVHALEIGGIVLICAAVALWSFSDALNAVSWKLGKAAALGVLLSTLSYTYQILPQKWKNARLAVLRVSTLLLSGLLFVPGVSFALYSSIFAVIVYLQVIYANILLYRSHASRSILFYLITGVMATVMIAFGMYETASPILGFPNIHGPLIGSGTFVASGWFLIVERGYFNNKTWTDYMIEVNHKEKLLGEQNAILTQANTNTITILTQTIEAKDPYTRGHCLRVRTYSSALGKAVGLAKEWVQALEYGALLHDIGKIFIPGKILNKNGKLDDEEFDLIKKHPQSGADILKNVEYFRTIIPMIRHHHESFDGKGYPDGLAGGNIPLEARILAVSDTYDALTSDRPYRLALTAGKALEILEQQAGIQLDPDIVRVFIDRRIYEMPHPALEPVFQA